MEVGFLSIPNWGSAMSRTQLFHTHETDQPTKTNPAKPHESKIKYALVALILVTGIAKSERVTIHMRKKDE